MDCRNGILNYIRVTLIHGVCHVVQYADTPGLNITVRNTQVKNRSFEDNDQLFTQLV